MTQTELFRPPSNDPDPEAEKLARREHPETSKTAAREVVPKLKGLRDRVFDLVRRHPGKTANELARIASVRDPREIGRRLPELQRAGLIRRIGPIVCSVTKKHATAWVPTR